MSRKSGTKIMQAGFTMIETVIAFAVLTAAILGPVTLVAFSLAQARSAENKLIAVNLGQEGLELIRAIRENNVICDSLSSHPPPVAVAWNANPNGGQALGQGTNNLFTVDANDSATMSCGSVTFSTPRPTATPTSATSPLNLNANGLYTYGAGTPTLFQRLITVCVPATSAPCNGAIDSDAVAASDQMEVISRVSWTDRGLPRSIEVRERLYNWR